MRWRCNSALGSPEHTKLFYQFVAKVGRPFDDDPPAPGVAACIVNLLCPRPEEYAGAFNQVAQPATTAAPAPSGLPVRLLPATVPIIATKVPR